MGTLYRFILTTQQFSIGGLLPKTVLPGNAANAKRCKLGPVSSGQSLLFDTLVDMVGRGSAHVETAAEIARAVEVDSASHPIHDGVRQLAACGSHGKHSQNTERDFQRLLRGANGLQLQPYNIKLKLQVP